MQDEKINCVSIGTRPRTNQVKKPSAHPSAGGSQTVFAHVQIRDSILSN